MKTSATAAALAAFFAMGVNALFTSTTDLALYWGQNSFNQSQGMPLAQQNLSTYCANTNVNVLPMAFVTKMTTGQGGQPVVNFANGGYSCTTFPGTQLWDCPTYEQDLQTCQQTYGKTILLSIGGAMYDEGGFKSQAQAVATANLIWNTFGPVNNNSGALRPFHNGVVDGFDLDIEQPNAYFRAFALRLRTLMSQDKSKQWYLTAAPQCPYPDVMNGMLSPMNGNAAVPFDALFIQYYNNAQCGLRTFNTSKNAVQKSFNFQTWQNWANTNSANKNVKLFLGVPGGPSAAQSGDYKNPAGLKAVINYCRTFANFGGVSVWDASQAYAATASGVPFLQNVKQALVSASKKARKTKRRSAKAQMAEN